MLETKKLVLPVDVNAAISAPEVMGWDGTKYIKAVASAQDSFDGDGVTTQFQLSNGDVVHGSVSVTVDGATKTEGVDYSVNYSDGKITFTAAPPSGSGNVVIDYSYFSVEPTAVLVEDVTASQSPAAALMVVFGIVYADEFASEPLEDVKARLRAHGIFVEKRASA